MKTTILRATLAIMLCTIAVRGWAQEPILSENFDSFNNNQAIAIEGWDFKYCWSRTFGIWTTKVLTIQDYVEGSSDKGYAKTPPLNYSGKAVLSFKYCATASNSTATIKISVSNGTIDGEQFVNVSSSNQTLTQKTYNLTLNQGSIITFAHTSKAYAAIDDILIVPDGILLSESTSNSSTIEENATKTVTVNTVRTLTGGIWNTLCLPFDVAKSDLEQTLGQDVQLRTFTGYADNVMAFTPANEIPAGTPFLIKLNTTVENPTFHAVTISDTPAATVTFGDVSFIGTYSPVDLETDGTELFITKNNTLSVPAATTNTMNGMRAYIRVPGTFNPSAARLAIDESTAIPAMNADRPGRSAAVYDLSGRQVAHPRCGLYIVDNRLTFIK